MWDWEAFRHFRRIFAFDRFVAREIPGMVRQNSDVLTIGDQQWGGTSEDDGELIVDRNSDSDSASVGSLIIHTPDGNPSDSDDYPYPSVEDLDGIVNGSSTIEDYEDPLAKILAGKPVSDEPVEESNVENKWKRCTTCGENILLTNLPKHFQIHPPSKYQDATKLERNLQELILQTAYEIRPTVSSVNGRLPKMKSRAAASVSGNKGSQSGNESDESGRVQKIRIRPLREIHRKPELLDPPTPMDMDVEVPMNDVVSAPVEMPKAQTPQKYEGSVKKPKILAVAKKSCSKKSQKIYLSESDEPITPTKTSKDRNAFRDLSDNKGHQVEAGAEESELFTPVKKSALNGSFETPDDTSEDEDEVPLVVRLRQEAEARGEKKSMPKPPPKPMKNKRPMKGRSGSELSSKKHRRSEADQDFLQDKDKKNKSKKPKQPTILKKSNPNWSKSVEAAAELIHSETKKDNPDMESLDEAMKKTFLYRKHMYDQNTDIARVLTTFPALQYYRFIKKDFFECSGKDLDTLERKLVDPLMLEYQMFTMKNFLSPDPVIAKAKEELKADPSDKDLLRDVQMLCLGFQKTKGKLLDRLYKQRGASEEKFKGVTPTIDIRNNIGSRSCKLAVYCEKIKICEVSNFFDGVMCVYALYWIFNLQYETSSQPLFEYFDSLIGN